MPLFQMLEQAHTRLDGIDQKIEASRPPTGFSTHDTGDHHLPKQIAHVEHEDVPSEDYEPGADAMQTPRTQSHKVMSPRPADVLVPDITGLSGRRMEEYDIEDEDEWGNEDDLHRKYLSMLFDARFTHDLQIQVLLVTQKELKKKCIGCG
jgi:hypothetical protein